MRPLYKQGGIVIIGRCYKTTKKRFGCISALGFIITAILFPFGAVVADPSSDNPPATGDDQIQIVADKLITNHAEKFAEFSGNVRASQGAFTIHSDRLRIYYQSASDLTAQGATGQESIQQIIATGNVTLSTGKFTAEADRAEYNLKTQVLVIVGESASLKSDRNILTGSTIIVDRKTGQMSVESNPQKRVKAVFYPD